MTIHIDGLKCLRRLGKGGFAATFLYEDEKGKYGKYVAVKVPHDKDKEFDMVRGDIVSLATLRNIPYIVQYLDTIQVGDRMLLVMEYVEGPLLRDLLGGVASGKALSIDKALRYTIQVAGGLYEAHRRDMVHRDIKPENIIIDSATDTAKILDFGIASMVGREGFFETAKGRYTPYYTPVEVLREKKGDHRVDIYSLGMTLYEMVTGILPYYEPGINIFTLLDLMEKGHPKPPRNFNPKIPLFLQDAILKAIAVKQDDRFQNMREFIAALEPPLELKLAEEHNRSGETRKAESVLRSLVKRCPSDPRGFIALAGLLNRCHRSREAREMLETAYRLEPDNPDICFSMAMTLAELGEKGEAEKYLVLVEKKASDAGLKKRVGALRKRIMG